MAQHSRRTTFEAGAVSFVVQHELWDGNIDDHSDQGVAILVTGQAGGKDTTLLRFNCFDLERSYVYGPETREQTLPHGSHGGRQPDRLVGEADEAQAS